MKLFSALFLFAFALGLTGCSGGSSAEVIVDEQKLIQESQADQLKAKRGTPMPNG